MDFSPDSKSRNFRSVICYRISNIMERAVVEEICSRKGVTLLYTQDSSELLRFGDGYLVICDLASLKKDDLAALVKSARTKNCRVLGSYPHVSRKMGETALSEGVDYIVPRSAFKIKLEQILTN